MSEITLPELGETITEGTITHWFKDVGDTITKGEPLFEVSTDKVDSEVPSPVDGVITEIRATAGETVDVGAIVAVIGEAPAPETPAAVREPEPALAAAPSTPEAGSASPARPTPLEPRMAVATAAVPTTPDGATRLLSPVVRRLAQEHSLDLDRVAGTGPGGRITRADVLDHVGPPSSSLTTSSPDSAPAAGWVTSVPALPDPVPPSASTTQADAQTPTHAPSTTTEPPAVAAGPQTAAIKLSKIRKLTGEHMLMSKSVSPHAFSVVEVDFANVDATRSTVKAAFKDAEGFSLTYLPFIARAIVDGLREFPHLNASVSGDELLVHGTVDLAVAVDLDHTGLVAPIVRNADGRRLKAIAREISDLAERARIGKLGPDEITGGTFTISNNGSAGSVLSMPIINQPQVGIISTDAIVRRPVVTPTSGGGDAIAIHPVGNLAMSWDHRAFDGAYAAGFLSRVKAVLETRDWGAEF